MFLSALGLNYLISTAYASPVLPNDYEDCHQSVVIEYANCLNNPYDYPSSCTTVFLFLDHICKVEFLNVSP